MRIINEPTTTDVAHGDEKDDAENNATNFSYEVHEVFDDNDSQYGTLDNTESISDSNMLLHITTEPTTIDIAHGGEKDDAENNDTQFDCEIFDDNNVNFFMKTCKRKNRLVTD